MTILRIIGGFICFLLAAWLGFDVVAVSHDVLLPMIQNAGREQTTFVIVHMGTFSFEGGQIWAWAGLIAVVSIGFALSGMYAFSTRPQK